MTEEQELQNIIEAKESENARLGISESILRNENDMLRRIIEDAVKLNEVSLRILRSVGGNDD